MYFNIYRPCNMSPCGTKMVNSTAGTIWKTDIDTYGRIVSTEVIRTDCKSIDDKKGLMQVYDLDTAQSLVMTLTTNFGGAVSE